MRSFALSVVAIAGCAQILGIGDYKGSSSPDAAGDGGLASDAQCGFSTLFDSCPLLASASPIAIDEAATFDTDTGMLAEDGQILPYSGVPVGSNLIVLVASTFSIGSAGSLTVTGSHPFGVIARDSITIDGVLDVGSHALVSGAGSRGVCGTQAGGNGGTTANPAAHTDGLGTGGGGGGNRGSGGNGGDATDTSIGTISGGVGGTADGACPIAPVGGCGGGSGGIGEFDTRGAPGGFGGGAVYLVSAIVTVSASGKINAGGAGGAGGIGTGNSNSGGGGGGGAGGMVMIETPALTIDGAVGANGGAGGQSGNTGNGGSGGDGSASNTPATCMGGSGGLALGGDGGAGAVLSGRSVSSFSAIPTGGGGGAVGFIRIPVTYAGAGVVSPDRCLP